MEHDLPHRLWQRLVKLSRRTDVVVLVGSLLIAVLLGLFVGVSHELAQAEPEPLDRVLLLALRYPHALHRPIGPAWLQETAIDITALGSWPVMILVALAVLGLLLLQRRWGLAAMVIASLGGGGLLLTLLKQAFARPRPDLVPHLVDVTTLSFPSSHAAGSAVTYATLAALATQLATRPLVKLYLLAVSLGVVVLVGITRVYLGVHYPSDVLAGWFFGLAWALLCLVITRVLARRGAPPR